MKLCNRTISHGRGKAKNGTGDFFPLKRSQKFADLHNLFFSMDLSSPYFAAVKCTENQTRFKWCFRYAKTVSAHVHSQGEKSKHETETIKIKKSPKFKSIKYKFTLLQTCFCHTANRQEGTPKPRARASSPHRHHVKLSFFEVTGFLRTLPLLVPLVSQEEQKCEDRCRHLFT